MNILQKLKKKMSVTYLVFDEEMEVAAIFSLTHNTVTKGTVLFGSFYPQKLPQETLLEFPGAKPVDAFASVLILRTCI